MSTERSLEDSQAKASIDVKDISLGDILKAITRLKISSALTIFALLAALVTVTAGVVRSRYANSIAQIEARKQFEQAFELHFADPSNLQKIVPNIQSLFPDGLSTYEEAMNSLLWQVKAQDGFAEFLSGTKSTSVQITFNGSEQNFDWHTNQNTVLDICKKLNQAISSKELKQINAELNTLGVGFLKNGHYIVRGLDGGMAVIGPSARN